MLFLIKNDFPVAIHSQLSRVWIKTGNPRMPLKGVWIDEAKLKAPGNEACVAEPETELAEGHLVLAA